MRKLIVPAIVGASLLGAVAGFGAPRGKWVEARSPNFIVVSNAGEGQARKTAAQFEQIRSLFRDSLPYVKAHSSPVITIFAVKDEDALRELLPEFWAVKNRVHPAGIFIGRNDEFEAAVNLEAHGDNPLETVYHEYYHSVTMPYFPGLPVWVAEGMADFFGNSEINGKNADVGLPNANLIAELRSNHLMPLSVLFKVDRSSPYYNEQNKVSIFYAESWALTHYLMLGDARAHNPSFGAYLKAISEGVSEDEAASKAFGDLGVLQQNLERYIAGLTLPASRVAAPEKIADSDLHVRALSDADVDAYVGGFLALHDQFKEAEPLLNEAAQADPKLELAQRNLGLMHYYRKENKEAVASLSAAIALDPKDAGARYLRALLTFQNVSQNDPQIEADLRQALIARQDFAAADSLLALYLAANDQNLPEALAAGRKAVTLEPGNASYQLELAQVYVRARRYDDAITLARSAQANASDSGQREGASQILNYATEARDADARVRQLQQDAAARTAAATPAAAQSDAAQPNDRGTEISLVPDGAGGWVSKDPRPSAEGLVTQVRCKDDEMDVTIAPEGGAAPVVFRAKNRNLIEYGSSVHSIRGSMDPCVELKGHGASLIYGAAEGNGFRGEIVRIDIIK